MTAEMRTGPASRDGDFRGIDPPALDQLLRQVQQANTAIRGWLAGHRPPPGVAATGYRQAEQVGQWAADQIGMLSRRYNFAITHPDTGGGVHVPPAAPPSPGPSGGGGGGGGGGTPGPRKVTPPASRPRPHRTTPNGAGDLGEFRTPHEAAKAARKDALAIDDAVKHHRPVPAETWKHLTEHAGDPDYTRALYERLGPSGAAELIKAAHGNAAHLKVVERSLGVASHHLTMNARWLDALLDESDRLGDHRSAVHVLTTADTSARTRDALTRLGLLHHAQGHAPAHTTPPAHAPAPPRHPIQPPAHPPATPGPAPDSSHGPSSGPATLVRETLAPDALAPHTPASHTPASHPPVHDAKGGPS